MDEINDKYIDIYKKLDQDMLDVIAEFIGEDMIKEDSIECCVCFELNYGVQLPNCNHFICSKCYCKIYYGYIDDTFYKNHLPPKYIETIKTPVYPYLNTTENLEIYNKLTNDYFFKEWFIDENEDLYNCVKNNDDAVYDISDKVKEWFITNENIKKYENDLIQHKINRDKFDKDMETYELLKKEHKQKNIKKKCPLCRL